MLYLSTDAFLEFWLVLTGGSMQSSRRVDSASLLRSTAGKHAA